MSWWDFVSDFLQIINDILAIPIFELDVGDGTVTIMNVGGVLCSSLLVYAVFFYLVPRR